MDREKYIEILSKAAKTVKEFNEDVPIKISLECVEDILALLKEQEAIEPLFNERMKHFVCPNCSLVLDEGRDSYCPSCGKRIAWVEYYIHEDETEGR